MTGKSPCRNCRGLFLYGELERYHLSDGEEVAVCRRCIRANPQGYNAAAARERMRTRILERRAELEGESR